MVLPVTPVVQTNSTPGRLLDATRVAGLLPQIKDGPVMVTVGVGLPCTVKDAVLEHPPEVLPVTVYMPPVVMVRVDPVALPLFHT